MKYKTGEAEWRTARRLGVGRVGGKCPLVAKTVSVGRCANIYKTARFRKFL